MIYKEQKWKAKLLKVKAGIDQHKGEHRIYEALMSAMFYKRPATLTFSQWQTESKNIGYLETKILKGH